MTPERRALWAAYIATLQDMMGLKDWVLRLSDCAPDDPNAGASCEDTFGQKTALICLAPEWEDYEPEKQRRYITHELIHPHFAQVWTWTNNRLHESYSPREFATQDATYTMLMEYGVDGLARVIAPHLPLPAEVVPELGPEPEQEVVEEPHTHDSGRWVPSGTDGVPESE